MGSRQRWTALLETELRRGLSFDIVLLDGPGRGDPSSLRPGDRIRYRVVVRNDADVPFRRVAGFVSDSPFVAFEARRFEVRDLPPRGRRSSRPSTPPSGRPRAASRSGTRWRG